MLGEEVTPMQALQESVRQLIAKNQEMRVMQQQLLQDLERLRQHKIGLEVQLSDAKMTVRKVVKQMKQVIKNEQK